MPRKPKNQPVDLLAIHAELLEQFGNGLMTAESIIAATLARKKALIERALGGEMNRHLAIRPVRPSRPTPPINATAEAPRRS